VEGGGAGLDGEEEGGCLDCGIGVYKAVGWESVAEYMDIHTLHTEFASASQ